MAFNFDFSSITSLLNKSAQGQGQPQSSSRFQMPSAFNRRTHLEINLVPDIKGEMIKTLKLRNFIFFLCIVVASASVGITLFFGIIAGGQKLAIDSKKGTIDKLSAKLTSYNDLDDFLTIKDQVGNITTLADNKKVSSRTFNILSALIPTGADSITVSDLDINLVEDEPTFTFSAQANAGTEPYIDYRVLESFKKSMDYVRYDYGNYVDKEGNTIPAYCMIESGNDGATFRDAEKGYYAFWTINEEGCNPSDTVKISDYNAEDYNNERVVRVWRTPQFSEWYKETEPASGPYMSLDGEISGVPHFNSACITYTGDDSQNSANPKWTDSNEECKLVPDGTNGISISESSNGRDTNGELVLRFSAALVISPEVYRFNNHHMLAIAPSGRVNVTDSYSQIQNMFGQRAEDCAKNDVTCNSTQNSGQDSGSGSNTNQNSNGGN